MKDDLFKYLKQNGLDFPDTKSQFAEAEVEKELGYELPEDYKSLMRNCYCCSFNGEHDYCSVFTASELMDYTTEPDYMIPLKGLLLIGGDNGGNFYAYDPKNKLGRGTFAVYFIDRSGMCLNEAKYIGANLTEAAENILKSDKGFYEWPTMEEDGFPQEENGSVPKATVNSMEDLLKALPKNIDHAQHGKGVLEIKEDKGLISGQYVLENDMMLCYTFSRSYQGFYDAIAPALKMYDII